MNKTDKPTEVKIEYPIIPQIGSLLKKTAKWVFVIIAIMVSVVLLFFAIRALIQGIIRKQLEITQANGLHGGPGSSMIPLIYKYQDTLEKEYTIVNWDQRTAGKTYLLNDKNTVDNFLSMEQMVTDVDEVVTYLKDKFQKEKIIILGHSWGSVLGTAYVQKYPDYPLVDGKYSEQAIITQRTMTSKYLAPNLKDKTISTILLSPYCLLNEGHLYLQPLLDRQKGLYDYLFYNMKNSPYSVRFEMPVIYIMGEDDWVSPNAPARAFLDKIEAPSKNWVTIKDAGHLSMIDNPEAFCSALIDALAGGSK